MIYVYAFTADVVIPDCEAVDGSRRFGSVEAGGVAAVFSPVDSAAFSQEVIDQRAGDLEWLGSIGYRHQAVMTELMKRTALVPLRAFTLFSGEEALRDYLSQSAATLENTLRRLDGKQEWTLRIELDPAKWSEALTSRVVSLRQLQEQSDAAGPGRAFLLRKKLEEEKKRASHQAEDDLLAELEREIASVLRCESVAESRQRREGAFPQISVLVNRDEETILQELQTKLNDRYAVEGVTIALLGPWPPYTFAGGAA